MNFLNGLYEMLDKSRVFSQEKMELHTTFKAGGPAKYLVKPKNEEELRNVLLLSRKENVPYYVVGNGSNLLVSDEGYDGVIILIGSEMSDMIINDNAITVKAGALMSAIGAKAREMSLTGFEFASGIPGTIGGACVMNAGAYGSEIKDVLKSVKVMDADGNVYTLKAEELDLSYRHSIIPDKGLIVMEAVIELSHGNQEEITAYMAELAGKRREKQPLEYPSAGSTFKRPEGMYAGALIEQCNLKGRGVGGACVSQKHAGFVINKNKATAKDIYDTIRLVQKTVNDETGVSLSPEVKFLGKFV